LGGLGKYKVNGKLQEIPIEKVNKRNTDNKERSLENRLAGLFGFGTDSNLPKIEGLIGVHKQVPEKMIRADILGLNVKAINSDGVAQDAKNSAFLALEYDKAGELKSYHVVNAQGTSITPIMYEFVGKGTVDVLAVANKYYDENGDQIPENFTAETVTSNILWGLIKRAFENEKKLPTYSYKKKKLFGYKINEGINSLETALEFAVNLPKGFLEKIGYVDNAAYFDILSSYVTLDEKTINNIKEFIGSAQSAKAKELLKNVDLSNKNKSMEEIAENVIAKIKKAREKKEEIESNKKPDRTGYADEKEYAGNGRRQTY